MNTQEEKEQLYNEDIERMAEGIREFLQDINISFNIKYEALNIVRNNFKEALRPCKHIKELKV